MSDGDPCRRLVEQDYDDLVRRIARLGLVETLGSADLTAARLLEPGAKLETEAVRQVIRRVGYRAGYRRHIRAAIRHGIRAAAGLDCELGDYS